MNIKRRYKLLTVMLIFISFSVVSALILYALRQNINLFYTPTQLYKGEIPHQQRFRMGGLVEKGSIHYSADGKQVSFRLSDTKHEVIVNFFGLLPDLFREGQGIVAQGQLNSKGEFIADQVLAKHDENYRPPEVKEMLEKK